MNQVAQWFIDSLSDAQFRLLWQMFANCALDGSALRVAIMQAAQRRDIGRENTRWATQLLADKEKDNASRP